jgi:hypothetical protein
VAGPRTGSGASTGAPVALLGARIRWTGRGEGDLRPGSGDAAARLAGLVDRPVAWLRQVHGSHVVIVRGPEPVQGKRGDALVTTSAKVGLAVVTADCAPIALASPEGVIGAVHAGWAGLVAGVVERAVDAMVELGATRVAAALGPCIHAECYEFGAAELEQVAVAVGTTVEAVEGVARSGSTALDLPAAVGAALSRAGAELSHQESACTACCADRLFSHRARGEAERQAMIVWRSS